MMSELGRTRILIVDDEPDIRESLSRHLRFCGYAVETAANGREALEKLERQKIDIVVSDLMMPEMDGIELLRQVRREYPMIHMIMITGFVTQENILACMRHGADCCLFKPLTDIGELEEAVTIAQAALERWKKTFVRLRQLAAQGRE
jgi:CheY-like chemotaxis protein